MNILKISILLIFLFSSCKKENFITENQYTVPELTIYTVRPNTLNANAIKHIPGAGSVVWKSSTFMTTLKSPADSIVKKRNLVFGTSYYDSIFLKYYLREVLSITLPENISVIKKGIRYKVTQGESSKYFIGSFYGLTDHADVVTREYNINPLFDNYIIFTDIDIEKRKMSGNFELHFKIDEFFKEYGYNENLFFENGRFEVNYEN